MRSWRTVIKGNRGDAVQSPALDHRNSFAQQLFAPLGGRYDRLAELLSFGQNGRWRRAMIDHIRPNRQAGHEPPIVLDVAAGTAGVSLQIAERTGARVIGLDLTEQMLRQGARNVAASGASDTISLVSGRAEQLPLPDAAVDALTFTYLLRYVSDPQATLSELARVVRPGGTVASLEFLVPPSAFWRFWWRLYTWLVLPLGGFVTGGREWYEVGRFLGPSIAGHYRRYPVDWTVRAWQQAGFHEVGYRVMSLGGGLVMWGTRAGG
jgi:demethylmenaquinone methyltransferase/2-methoxy-6-polyprenyl-1,4-benzoquinol methylase